MMIRSGVRFPMNIAITCCNPSGIACFSGIRPSKVYGVPHSWTFFFFHCFSPAFVDLGCLAFRYGYALHQPEFLPAKRPCFFLIDTYKFFFLNKFLLHKLCFYVKKIIMFLFSRQPASCTEFHKKETPVCVPHLTDQCLLVFFLQFKRSGNPQSLLRCGYILPSPSASDHPSRSPAAVLTARSARRLARTDFLKPRFWHTPFNVWAARNATSIFPSASAWQSSW